MTAKQAIELAKTKPGLSALILEGVHAAVSTKDAEKMDARGVCFAYLGEHEGKIVAIPNGND